jgi:prepilin-type N-terminal cleavage/methylation domain-containing protein
MASISPIKDRSPRAFGAGGFTLLELMMVTAISAFVFSGVLSAYIFMGRGLTRQVNEEGLESRTRLALYWFTQDVSGASSIIAENPGATTSGTLMTLYVPSLGNTVIYETDWSNGVGNGLLTRQVGAAGTKLTLLTNLTSFAIGYYDPAGNSVTVPTSTTTEQVDIKQAYMVYTSTAGVKVTGAQSNLTIVSPRVTLKNKGILTDPTTP